MIFERFVATKIQRSAKGESTVSSRIIKIAIVAIALGMVMMLIAMATSLGLQKEIKRKTVALTGDIQIAPFENNNSTISVSPIEISSLAKDLWFDDPRITDAFGYVSKGVLLKTKKEFEGGVLRGVDSLFPWQRLKPYLVKGDFPIFSTKISKQIVLSVTIASKLNVGLGDRVTAFFQSKKENLPGIRYFSVVGIYQTGFPYIDDNVSFVDIRQLQRLNKWAENEIGGFVVYVEKENDRHLLSEELYQKLPPHIDVRTVEQLYEGIYDWISLFDFNVLIILCIMIIVGTLNMATALLVLILERAHMIGVLKVFGASQRQLQNIFLISAVKIIGKGMVWGNGIGLVLLWSQHRFQWIQLDPNTYFVDTVPVLLPWAYFIALNILVLVVCVALLWLPVKIVAYISPIRVLKMK